MYKWQTQCTYVDADTGEVILKSVYLENYKTIDKHEKVEYRELTAIKKIHYYGKKDQQQRIQFT